MQNLKTIFVLIVYIFSLPLFADSYQKYGKGTAPLSREINYLHKSKSQDFWFLSSSYVGQFNDYSCSAASIVTAVNALLYANNKDIGEEFQNIKQQDIIKKTKSVAWDALVSEQGLKGKHGLTIFQLQDVTKEVLKIIGLDNYDVQLEQFTQKDAVKLDAILEQNEKSIDDVVMIHFVQDLITDAKGGPYAHISVIGAYNKKDKRVLIMDVDRTWYGPYWTTLDRLLNALDASTAAFGKGGIVKIIKK